jgi:hypothetical protein
VSTFEPAFRLWPGKNASTDAATWGVGVNITGYVRRPGNDGGQVVSYSSGRQDEGNQIDAGSMNLTLDNRDGRWTNQNVLGPYYGQLKRNTPIQLTMPTGSDAFTRVVASGLGSAPSGQAWTASSAWSVNGSSAQCSLAANVLSRATLASADCRNFDIRYTCWVSAVATGASLVMAGNARFTSTSDALIFRCEFNTAGTVDARIGHVTGAVDTISSALAVFSYTANEKIRVRCQGDGQALRMKIWKPANPADPDADEPDAWNTTGTDTTMDGSGVGLWAWRVVGNTNVSPLIHADDWSCEAEEWTGAVAQWPTRWSMDGNNSWAPIQAAGILRRLRQTRGDLQSPLRRQLAAYGPSAFIPAEDEEGATTLASAVTGQQTAILEGVTPGAATDLPGAFRAPTFDNATSSIMVRTSKSTVGQTGFSVMWLMKMAALPGATTRVAYIRSTGRITRWEIYMDNASIRIDGYEGGVSTPVVTNTALYGTEVNPLEWFAIQLETETIGATTFWSLLTHAVGDVTYYTQNGSYASSTASIAGSLLLGGTLLQGAAFSMMWIGPNTLPFVTDSFSLVSSGYVGELASARAQRVAGEVGILLTVEPGTSEAMGAQTESRALEALRSCEITDYGILYESGTGLGFRPRTARYNPPVLLTLSMTAGQIGAPPEPIYDDQRLRNVWTVSRAGGSSATVVDDASVMLEGESPDSATINSASDAVLTNHAGWRVMLGTQEDLRWPAITLDFTRNPSLIPFWLSRTYGFRFTATTGLDQVVGAEADVIAEGYQAELHPDGWRVTLSCSGASPWDVGVLDDADARLDTAGCELTGAVNASTLTWAVTTTEGPSWNPSTTFPILMKCGGEIVSVSSITGAGPGQTLNLGARAVNGVSTTHDAGDAVSLAYPARLAL